MGLFAPFHFLPAGGYTFSMIDGWNNKNNNIEINIVNSQEDIRQKSHGTALVFLSAEFVCDQYDDDDLWSVNG